ncbi:response regulator [Luteimonas sp. MC1572]|uniref:response regulator n=1 Tax=Luteimonas sp. MC1572 TaxID=2799325 RepID=UPI0018F0F289|nr:response regulator [Luteimonas sp. MC1572]MBJ6982756.1 response regulator [Luteimonas sp. MC1572]QQO03992.1 response regulator [Luteimonas sp. MC1572]
MPPSRLLLVEDEDDLRFLICDALSDLGYEVTTASNGKEAIAELNGESRFDHVVTDVSMPHGISGLDVAAEAAKVQPLARLVLVSGYQRSQLPQIPEGTRFLPKPYRIHQLLGVLQDEEA